MTQQGLLIAPAPWFHLVPLVWPERQILQRQWVDLIDSMGIFGGLPTKVMGFWCFFLGFMRGKSLGFRDKYDWKFMRLI